MISFPVSRLGYGCYALGGAYGGQVEVSRAIKLIELAYDLGIRFFDTADQYGSEEVLGKAVQTFRQQVAIATKVGADSAGKAGLSRAQIIVSCEASLKRLATDYIDLYQVHYDDPGTPVAEVVETLELLKKQGKILSYGVGHLPLNKTQEYLELGRPQTILAEMNAAALNRFRELHPLQGSFEFDIIAFSVTGRGLLTGKISSATEFSRNDIRRIDPLFKRKKLAMGLRIMEKLTELGREVNASPAQLAIAWVLNQPGVVAALTGPTNPCHLRENCAALNIALDSNLTSELDGFIFETEAELNAELVQEVWSIVNTPISHGQQGGEDLVYVLEHCIEDGLIPYKAGVQLFSELLQSKGQADLALLGRCQEKIKALLGTPSP